MPQDAIASHPVTGTKPGRRRFPVYPDCMGQRPERQGRSAMNAFGVVMNLGFGLSMVLGATLLLVL
ncbi:MAG TPA: hypothetical protein PLL33_06615 [Paracoccus sp. (in: a-proteobacteria)]|nr:hypothetical protein [Paracoccus sp. (in: a-proteobacteria)]